MSLVRDKYGIEYNPRQAERQSSSGLGWVFVAVAVIASISLAWSLFSRLRLRERAVVVDTAEPVSAPGVVDETTEIAEPPPVATVPLNQRPAKLRNLLMRLEVAERNRNSEMAVTTIEQIRSLPGAPAADIDGHLARRLGDLNIRRLLKERCAQWVRTVTVRRGDSAARIAREHGSTFASLVLLNEGRDMSRLVVGQKVRVMDHPRFRLEVNCGKQTADLYLNGKFFRRYDMESDVGCRRGRYALSETPRQFWAERGIRFRRVAAAELEQLLPAGTPVLVGAEEE